MKLTRSRPKSIDARTVILALIGLVFLGSGDMARGQGNPDPRINSITPNFAVAGGPGFTLTVSGFNFVSGSVVRWNGANRTTTVVNSFQLSATIASGDIAAAGTVSVTVFNPPPGGGSSNALEFFIQPVPRITSINPASALAGGAAFTLTIVGTNFYSPDPDTGGGGSRVQWNGSDRSTSYGGNTQLTASILASDLATAGTATVTVFTPGIGTSNPATFTINNRMPQITAINPASADPRAPGLTP